MDKTYCYPPDYSILKNKLNIRDNHELDIAERLLVTQRIEMGSPGGRFDLDHLKSIHHHLFQDIYDWAGETRTVEISKGESAFQPHQFIEAGLADVHKRILAANYLQNTNAKKFSEQAGRIIGDINYVHPFREGNGRTQLQFLEQLAERAGHPIKLLLLDSVNWIEAAKQSFEGDYDLIGQCIFDAIKL